MRKYLEGAKHKCLPLERELSEREQGGGRYKASQRCYNRQEEGKWKEYLAEGELKRSRIGRIRCNRDNKENGAAESKTAEIRELRDRVRQGEEELASK